MLKPLWKKIWKLPLPCKVRNFLCRACRNAIPTMTNLLRRYVVDDPMCSLCSQHNEDVLHSLWSCSNLEFQRTHELPKFPSTVSPRHRVKLQRWVVCNAGLDDMVLKKQSPNNSTKIPFEPHIPASLWSFDAVPVCPTKKIPRIPFSQVCAGRLNWVRFQHVSRDGNNIVHNHARYAHNITSFSVWMEYVPVHCFVVY